MAKGLLLQVVRLNLLSTMAKYSLSLNATTLTSKGSERCGRNRWASVLGLLPGRVIKARDRVVQQCLLDEMLMEAASNALAAASPLVNTGQGSLLPPLAAIAEISREIAFESLSCVGRVAMEKHG